MTASDPLPPEVHTIDLYIGDRFWQRVSREVYEEELEIAKACAPTIRAMLTEGLAWFEEQQRLSGGNIPAGGHAIGGTGIQGAGPATSTLSSADQTQPSSARLDSIRNPALADSST